VPDTNAIHAYWVTYLLLICVGFGLPPLPEEIPVVAAGGFAAHPESGVKWWIMLLVCIAGVVTSDGLLYLLGRFWGRRLLHYRWVRNHLLPAARLEHIENNFHKYGIKILLVARVLPGIRSPLFMTAGMMRLSFARFLLADGIYAVPGVSLLFYLGYAYTDKFLEVLEKAERFRPLIIVVVLGAVGTYLFYHFVHSPVTTGDPQELPPMGKKVIDTLSGALKPVVPTVLENGKPLPNNKPIAATPNPKQTPSS
jgi:membrane protein DedA with SNARE-associated domain